MPTKQKEPSQLAVNAAKIIRGRIGALSRNWDMQDLELNSALADLPYNERDSARESKYRDRIESNRDKHIAAIIQREAIDTLLSDLKDVMDKAQSMEHLWDMIEAHFDLETDVEAIRSMREAITRAEKHLKGL